MRLPSNGSTHSASKIPVLITTISPLNRPGFENNPTPHRPQKFFSFGNPEAVPVISYFRSRPSGSCTVTSDALNAAFVCKGAPPFFWHWMHQQAIAFCGVAEAAIVSLMPRQIQDPVTSLIFDAGWLDGVFLLVRVGLTSYNMYQRPAEPRNDSVDQRALGSSIRGPERFHKLTGPSGGSPGWP
jgi:hypothetical protein